MSDWKHRLCLTWPRGAWWLVGGTLVGAATGLLLSPPTDDSEPVHLEAWFTTDPPCTRVGFESHGVSPSYIRLHVRGGTTSGRSLNGLVYITPREPGGPLPPYDLEWPRPPLLLEHIDGEWLRDDQGGTREGSVVLTPEVLDEGWTVSPRTIVVRGPSEEPVFRLCWEAADAE